MASTSPCEQFISGYSAEEVFWAGIWTENLPDNSSFDIEIIDSDHFKPDAQAVVRLELPIFGEKELTGSVTEFKPAELLQIDGKEKGLGSVRISIPFEDEVREGQSGTLISPKIMVTHCLTTKPTERPVKAFLDKKLPAHAEEHAELVTNMLREGRVPALGQVAILGQSAEVSKLLHEGREPALGWAALAAQAA